MHASMNRRRLLLQGSGLLAGLALGGCAPPAGRRPELLAPAVRGKLPLPLISEQRVVSTMAGLRPYRASGCRIEPEAVDGRLLIHAYGHGGAGMTLSWGTAERVTAYALEQPARRAAVIGCGVVGLAVARRLQDHGFEVTIYARELPPNTTSNLSGALWAPTAVVDTRFQDGPFARDILPRLARDSHRWFRSLTGEHYGVRRLPFHTLGNNPQGELSWVFRLTPELYAAERLRAGQHPFGGYAGVWRLDGLLIEPDRYLRALVNDFRLAGGRVVVRDFATAVEVLALEEPLIVNCTGLGAGALFGDEQLVPVRGQTVLLQPQPELDYMYVAAGAQMFPRSDGVLLGGTADEGEWSVTPDPVVTAAILARHRAVVDRIGAG